jgi:hypothetical protein
MSGKEALETRKDSSGV